MAELYDCRSLTEDERFVHLYGAREAIATSSGLSDSGLFERSLDDERYLPFEYAGAVSKWCLKLLPENNAFELDSVTDVVIQVKYTAREGGDVLRRESTRRRLLADGWRLFDVRREFTDAWALLERDLQKSENGHARKEVEERTPHRKPTRPELRLILNRNMFPFLTGRRSVSVVRLQLFIQLEEDVQHAGSYIKVKYCPVGHQYQEEEEDEKMNSTTVVGRMPLTVCPMPSDRQCITESSTSRLRCLQRCVEETKMSARSGSPRAGFRALVYPCRPA